MITWSFLVLDEVDSTQSVAKRLGVEGSPEGMVVVAKRQSAGRGRLGRHWVSPEGGLYMSILLRPPDSAQAQTLTLLAAMAVVHGTKEATGLKTLIRWPNDVVVDGKKISGVIAESSFSGERMSFVVVGIGVNCNTKISSAKIEGNKATSLSEELGIAFDIPRVRQSILSKFGGLYEEWNQGVDVVERARGLVGTVGKRVEVRMMSGERIEGTAIELTETGGLLVTHGERRTTLRPEDIELLRES
ncbi:MAG: biotin--[acetyl-CoA-carboxylase] ligase [Nitrososphaerales archaeon]|nr:biotin--[acetyl-CoA-carboxylase] ligase [Nitrososphaerales archaeon]